MKRKKIIALTSILTFSLNVFAPTIFAEEFVTDSNIISSENKTNQENVENNEAKNEISANNNDKSTNNIEKDNNVDKETTIRVDDNIDSNNSDIKKEETTENDKLSINPNVENSSNETNKDVANENFSNTSKSEYAYIPDKNLKAGLNSEIARQTSTSRTASQDIKISELQSLSGRLYLGNRGIFNLTGLEHCTSITELDLQKNRITDINPIRNLTQINSLYLNNNEITSIEPISNLTKINTLYLANNNINDLTALKGFTSFVELQLYNNKVSDVSPLANLKYVNSMTLGAQRIDAPQVTSIGPNAIVDNLIKDKNGDYVNIDNTNDYTYDSKTHKITFKKIKQTGPQSYTFQYSMPVGDRTVNFAGTVTQNIVYNEFADIPDSNLKAGLNKEIAKQTSTSRTDTQAIKISELQSLRGSLVLDEKGISNLTGLEHCTGITSLSLQKNRITNLNPLRNLTQLTSLYLNNNKITSIEPISNLTRLDYLHLHGNDISDLTPLKGFTSFIELKLYGNKISDISPLKNIKRISGSITLGGQRIDAPQVTSIGPNATVENLIKDKNGDYVNIDNTNDYTYDSKTHKITFNKIKQTGSQSYTFQNKALIGGLNANFAGTVTQNIVYDQIIEIPDPNFKACLNRNIHDDLSGLGKYDTNPITLSQLEGLTEISRYLVKGSIENITGIEYCKNLTKLYLQRELITDLSPLKNLTKLEIIWLDGNQIEDLSNLSNLTNLVELSLEENNISNIQPLSGLANLNTLYLNNNHIVDLSPLDNFKANSLWLRMENQSITLGKNVVDGGSLDIPNPVTFPRFYDGTPNISISPNGSIEYVKEGNKLNLSNLNDSTSEFTINESATLNTTNINGDYSVNIILPVEHVSTIKVDLPTSMTFNVVTNTVNSEPVFATANYTINNNGKKPVSITPSYTVTSPGGIDLVESISKNDIAKDNNVKIAVKLRDITNNKELMSVVNDKTGTQFSVGAESNVQLKFEPGTNGMADAKKEQLSDTKTTSGKMTFTISN